MSFGLHRVLVLTKRHGAFGNEIVADDNRPFAAKTSRDLLFIKLWAATLRIPEIEKTCRKHQNGQVRSH